MANRKIIIVLATLLIASLVGYIVFRHGQIFAASNNPSLALQFVIAFIVMGVILTALLRTGHPIAGLLFFIYIIWNAFMLWIASGMVGTVVSGKTATLLFEILVIPTLALWAFGFFYAIEKAPEDWGTSTALDQSDQFIYERPSKPSSGDVEVAHYGDVVEYNLGYYGIGSTGTSENGRGWRDREIEQERERKRQWEREEEERTRREQE
ncbi:MAG: hypothetical protein QW478_14995 [Candidatus Micrarchaeaceae archaeon]